MMKRTAPTERVTDGSLDDDRLDVLLGNWATWMQTGTYGQGYPRRSPGMKSSERQDVDTMLRAIDIRLAKAMDAMVDSLPHNERIAIMRFYGLTADVWRLREPWDVLEARARTMIRTMMRARRVE